jgi:hypothetical protein
MFWQLHLVGGAHLGCLSHDVLLLLLLHLKRRLALAAWAVRAGVLQGPLGVDALGFSCDDLHVHTEHGGAASYSSHAWEIEP